VLHKHAVHSEHAEALVVPCVHYNDVLVIRREPDTCGAMPNSARRRFRMERIVWNN